MPETFITPDNALLWLNLETTTEKQDALLDALIPWADNVIISEIGFDPRTDPDYVGHNFGDLVMTAAHLIVSEFREITNETAGLEESSFNALTMKFSQEPIITPQMEKTFHRYRKINFY